MPGRAGCSRGKLSVALAALSVLGWGGCEPLDLALFPVTQDASVPPPIDVPPPPPSSPPADAGSDGGGAALPPPSPCLSGAAACEACVLAASCAPGYVCHPASGECVPPCASGEPQCPGGLVCGALDVCVECSGNAQCTVYDDDEPRCDVQRGVCVECLSNEHCTDDPFERPVCLTGGICGCASNSDCSGGAICELDEGHCELEDD